MVDYGASVGDSGSCCKRWKVDGAGNDWRWVGGGDEGDQRWWEVGGQ